MLPHPQPVPQLKARRCRWMFPFLPYRLYNNCVFHLLLLLNHRFSSCPCCCVTHGNQRGGKKKTRKQTAGLIDVGSFFCGFSCYSVFRLVACDSCTAPGAVCICSKPRYLASLIAMHRHNECNEDGADDGQRSSSSSNLLV